MDSGFCKSGEGERGRDGGRDGEREGVREGKEGESGRRKDS